MKGGSVYIRRLLCEEITCCAFLLLVGLHHWGLPLLLRLGRLLPLFALWLRYFDRSLIVNLLGKLLLGSHFAWWRLFLWWCLSLDHLLLLFLQHAGTLSLVSLDFLRLWWLRSWRWGHCTWWNDSSRFWWFTYWRRCLDWLLLVFDVVRVHHLGRVIVTTYSFILYFWWLPSIQRYLIRIRILLRFWCLFSLLL